MTQSRQGEDPETIRERLRVFAVEVLSGARDQGIPTSPMATILVAPRKRRKRQFLALQQRLLKKIQRRIRNEVSHEDIRRLINATAAEEFGIRFVFISDADDLLQHLERMEGDSMGWFVDGDYVFVETWYEFG